MDFFNKKEDVIEIQLTPLGKEALSKGELKFQYYSFHDTDIVYDPRYMFFTESQFTQVDRIQNTERLKIQNNFKPITSFAAKLKNTPENDYEHHSFLGSAEIAQTKYQALSIKPIFGHYTGTISFEETLYSSQRVPVLQIELDFEIDILNKQISKDPFLLLEVKELNGIFKKENFEVSIFELDSNDFSKMKQIYFYEFEENFEQNISDLLSEADIESELSVDDIEYYFSLQVDNYIRGNIEFSNLEEETKEELKNILYSSDYETC